MRFTAGSTCEVPQGTEPLVASSEQPGLIVPKLLGNWAKFISHPAVRYTHPTAPSAMSLWLRSVQLSVAVDSAIGLYVLANPYVPACSYRPTLSLTAVFALPNRS